MALGTDAGGKGRYNRRRHSAFLFLLTVLACLPPQLSRSQSQISRNFPLLDWQPTRIITGGHYVGSRVCATCHVAESAHQASTSMGRALSPVGDCRILQSHPHLSVRLGDYTFTIQTEGRHSIFSVAEGRHSLSVPLVDALGQGSAGQTYLYKSGGSYFESEVSYFNAIQGLDLTLGHRPPPPESGRLEDALGQRLDNDDAVRCFACHSTTAVQGSSLQLERMIPGITCEGCHGPGGGHVAAVKRGELSSLHIFNPGKLDPGDEVDFCGSCHRTGLDVANMNASGVPTVRFQPYRLILSKCFEGSKLHLDCASCHNPHEPLQTSEAYYDSKCLDCHNGLRKSETGKTSASAKCPVSNKNCVTCHMPKTELLGSHHQFTDHDIRIVRANQLFPG